MTAAAGQFFPAAALLWGFAAGRGAASCRLPELEFPYGGYNGRVG
ncbi:MAG: hypothetical protein UDC04_07645 [Collinsella bouchesdurhonensis]|nr:hypothetical protein [Collinsella bouchesdurhonensis]